MGLGGVGLGLTAAGFGMNALGIGSDPRKAVNKELSSYQRDVQGGWKPVYGKGKFGGLGAPTGREWVPGRADPQAGPAQLAQTSGFRTNQEDLIRRLEALSKGQGPSLAAEQLRQATDRNMSQQASIAQSGRGNAALAGLTAANASQQLGQQAASDSAVARIAEQQMALQQLQGAIGTGRGQDQELGQFNALQQNFRDQFNIEAQLRARGLNDAAIQAILGMKANMANSQGSTGDQLMAGGAGLLAMSGSNSKGGGGGGQAYGSAYGMPGTTHMKDGWYNLRPYG